MSESYEMWAQNDCSLWGILQVRLVNERRFLQVQKKRKAEQKREKLEREEVGLAC